jgi:hypothetical protein
MAYSWFLPERKDETDTEKMLNNLMDRMIIAQQRQHSAQAVGSAVGGRLLDKLLKTKEDKYRNTEQKLGILERSRALGLSPRQALNDDFLDEEADDETVRDVILAKRAANTVAAVPKAFSYRGKVSNTFSELISALKHR